MKYLRRLWERQGNSTPHPPVQAEESPRQETEPAVTRVAAVEITAVEPNDPVPVPVSAPVCRPEPPPRKHPKGWREARKRARKRARAARRVTRLKRAA